MEAVINQILALSTTNHADLKKLNHFLCARQQNLKDQAGQIEQALQTLDPAVHSMGIAFLLQGLLSAARTPPCWSCANQRTTFTYVSNFLKVADEMQVKKAAVPMNAVCKYYAQIAIEDGQQSMMRSIPALRSAIEKLRPDEETLTPVHAEYLRVCLKAKAYHVGGKVLDQPIFDIALSNNSQSNGSCTQMTAGSFLQYFYYGALIRIGMKDYTSALQLLLVVLTCPASCLSAIQADGYKKYALLSLKVNGDLPALPVYASHIVQRYAKSPGYSLDILEAYKQGDLAALKRVAEEKSAAIQADSNMGLVNQVIESLHRHKVRTLTKTYLTLSLGEIARELGLSSDSALSDVENLLFDMISSGEINARIDQSTGNVSFEDDDQYDEMDVGMVNQLQDKLAQILTLAGRISEFEHEVISSEAYIRQTSVVEGSSSRSGAPSRENLAAGGYDFMEM